jgi:hypothetical protein
VLLALAQLRLPAAAQEPEDGVPAVAAALEPGLTPGQVRHALTDLYPGFVEVIPGGPGTPRQYRLNPIFEGEIVR